VIEGGRGKKGDNKHTTRETIGNTAENVNRLMGEGGRKKTHSIREGPLIVLLKVKTGLLTHSEDV